MNFTYFETKILNFYYNILNPSYNYLFKLNNYIKKTIYNNIFFSNNLLIILLILSKRFESINYKNFVLLKR